MTAALRARCLRRRGAACMARYVAACAEIAGFDGRHSFDVAEIIAPSLARLRRHALACAKLSRRLTRTHVG